MQKILIVAALSALFAGGALAARDVPSLVLQQETTPTGTTDTATTGTTTTGTTDTATTGTTTTGETETDHGPPVDDTHPSRVGMITICHKTSSPVMPGVTITVSKNAWPAHQAHGDTEGPCSTTGTGTTGTTTTVTVQQKGKRPPHAGPPSTNQAGPPGANRSTPPRPQKAGPAKVRKAGPPQGAGRGGPPEGVGRP